MKKNIFGLLATVALGATLMTSCASDEPWGDGEGTLAMKMVMNSTLTRDGSNIDDASQKLADDCIVYISSSKGLIHKYKGIDNLPSSLTLKSGPYVAEAWTGDSVPASFDKKFYRGYQPFEIRKGEMTNVVVQCKIANAVTTVNPTANFLDQVSDYTVTIGHSRGKLEFTADNITEHGYFMMPYDKDTGAFEPNLTVTVTGHLKDGSEFEHAPQTIFNVQRAHEYIVNLDCTPYDSTPYGGAMITISIDDHELLVEDTVEISGAPKISGVGYNINEPMLNEPGKFTRHSIFVQSLGEIKSLAVHSDSYQLLGLPSADFDFLSTTQMSAINAAGMSVEYGTQADGVHTARIYLEKEMLDKLTEGVHNILVTAIDSNAKKRTATLTINCSNAYVVLTESTWTEVYATRATLHANVARPGECTNPGIQYREAGTQAWQKVYPTSMNGDAFAVEISGLKPGTRYEYQAIADNFVNQESYYITTESKFIIPNAGFELWSTTSDTPEKGKTPIVASGDGTRSFWDSGNHGSIKLDVNLTTGSSDVKHSGSYSAKLASQKVSMLGIGKFAAGNIFAGLYKKTDGMDGVLEFGREYNGSRPVKLRGYVYYRPGIVDESADDDLHPDVVKGKSDRGAIYVALTTTAYEIRTKKSNRQLFDANDSGVLAYGQLIFTEEYGSASQMREFEIILEYKDAARLQRATHLVLTASASQYGDYFSGSTSSVMYLDDLEFVY